MEAQLASCVASAVQLERARFARAWHALGARDDYAFEFLAAAYAEPHRAYHTAEHVAECLGWLDARHSLAERPDEVEIALTFHDAVYDPRASDSEQRTVALFGEHARRAGLASAVCSRIAGLIAATEHHVPTCADAALVCDIDLAILGSSPARYMRYERDVRAEYAHVIEPAFRAGRARILRSLLERWSIYHTPCFAARLEAQARQNVSQALCKLMT